LCELLPPALLKVPLLWLLNDPPLLWLLLNVPPLFLLNDPLL
jgi:hypothetical protein